MSSSSKDPISEACASAATSTKKRKLQEEKAEAYKQLQLQKKQRIADDDDDKWDDDPNWESYFRGLRGFEGQYLSQRDCLAKFTSEFRGWEYINRSLDEGDPFIGWDKPLNRFVYLWPNIFQDIIDRYA